jgi:L-fucose isomerase-like protein
MKVGLISLGFPNFRYDIGDKYLKSSIEKLKSPDYEFIYEKDILIDEEKINNTLDRLKEENLDLLIVQCGTYTYGSAMAKIIENFFETPLLIWGFREPFIEGFRGLALNSLCGLNMFGSFLHKANKKYSYVFGNLEEEKVMKKIKDTITAVKVRAKLKQSKFCIIGGRVPGFYLSNVDELRFRFEIGPEIRYYSIASLLDDAKNIDTEIVQNEVNIMKKEVDVFTTTDEMLEKSARIYLAIKNFKEKNNIDCFTIKCWPEFQQLFNCSVCGVVSRLNNEGIMVSCEGDITGLLTMYIQYLISNEPCFFADIVNVNMDDVVKVWHCGPAPVCLAKKGCTTKYTEHPTMKNGLGFATEFKLKQGKLIMIKIKEDKNRYTLFMAKGTGIEEDRDLVANQADIKFDVPSEKIIDTIMTNGIEHHFAIVYKDIESEIIETCKWIGIDIIKI